MPFVRYGLAAERVGQLKLVAVNFAIPLEEVLSVYVSNEMNYAKLMEVVSQRMLEGATDSTAATTFVFAIFFFRDAFSVDVTHAPCFISFFGSLTLLRGTGL